MKKVVISLGNPLKSDDNIGNIVLEKLKTLNENTELIKAEITPENFLEKLKKINPDIIFFLDAVIFDGEVGNVKTFTIDKISEVIPSTHNLPVSLFRKFLPKTNIILIGIKPKKIDYGEKLSPELENKIDEIVEKVKEIIL